MSIVFPFPDRELALREVEADPTSSLLDERERAQVAERAWEYGHEAALRIWESSGRQRSIRALLAERDVAVITKAMDYVYAGRRYFSIYETGKNRIVLYSASIALWAEKNELAYDRAVEMILCHEFFHCLEAKEIGYASKLVSLPIIKIGKWKFGEKGIRALSEVGAHSFARTYYENMHSEEG